MELLILLLASSGTTNGTQILTGNICLTDTVYKPSMFESDTIHTSCAAITITYITHKQRLSGTLSIMNPDIYINVHITEIFGDEIKLIQKMSIHVQNKLKHRTNTQFLSTRNNCIADNNYVKPITTYISIVYLRKSTDMKAFEDFKELSISTST